MDMVLESFGIKGSSRQMTLKTLAIPNPQSRGIFQKISKRSPFALTMHARRAIIQKTSKTMNIEVKAAIKKQVGALLDNPILISLLKNKFYEPDSDTSVRLDGDFNFTLGMDGDSLYIKVHNIKPQITARRGVGLFKVDFKGRLSGIKISRTVIMLEIDGLPDYPIELE